MNIEVKEMSAKELIDELGKFLNEFFNEENRDCNKNDNCVKEDNKSCNNEECVLYWRSNNYIVMNMAVKAVRNNPETEYNKLLPIYDGNNKTIGYFVRVKKSDIQKWNVEVKDFGKPGIYYLEKNFWSSEFNGVCSVNDNDKELKDALIKIHALEIENEKLKTSLKNNIYKEGYRLVSELKMYLDDLKKNDLKANNSFIEPIRIINRLTSDFLTF